MTKEKIKNQEVNQENEFNEADGNPSCEGSTCANVADEEAAAADNVSEEAEATAEEKIYFEGGNLNISGVTGPVTVCNAAGVVIMQTVATDNITIPVSAKGVYIVTTQKGSYKVVRY